MKSVRLKEQILAIMLMFAMVITFFPQGVLSEVSASETEDLVNVHLHFYNNFNWKTPAIQYWGGDTTEILNTGETVYLEDWKTDVIKLKAEENGWYEVTLKGDFEGFQFLDYSKPENNTGGTGYVNYMQYCTEDKAIDLYCKFDESTDYKTVWYLDKEYKDKIDSLAPTEAEAVSENNQIAINDNIYALNRYGAEIFESIVTLEKGEYLPVVTVLGKELSTKKILVKNKTDVKIRVNKGVVTDSINNAEEFKTSANIVGSFSELDFTKNAISDWNPKDTNGTMDYVGGGIYTKTLHFKELTDSIKLEYKVAFDGNWDYSIGKNGSVAGGGNISVTIPAGSSTFTVICNQVSECIYDSARNIPFNTNIVSLIGTVRAKDSWNEANEDYDFTQINDHVLVRQEILAVGSYEYKAVFNHKTWMEGENTSLKIKNSKKNVVFVYDKQTEKVYDSVNNNEDVSVLLKGGSLLGQTEESKSQEEEKNQKGAFTYNVYYYDSNPEHMSTDAADLWAWEDGGDNLGPIEFKSLEKLADGNQWLKATIKTDAVSLGFIPRSAGEWNWQTGNHYYQNKNKASETNLYIVYGDDNNTYTELPLLREARERYVVVEYNRPKKDYVGWNVYSWNSGFGSETEIYSQDVNGKQYFVIPVKDSEKDFILGFCMRYTTKENAWEKKDGSDHYVTVPANQNVVKVNFEQDKGVVSTLAYNNGYEMNGAKNEINFYYRDDSKIVTNSEVALNNKVQIVINGKRYAMSYDEKNERYVYTLKNCKAGKYGYYYQVNGENKLDEFNSDKITYGNTECSCVEFKKFTKLFIKASLKKNSMNYNDNNVLSVAFQGDDKKNIKSKEIKSVVADLRKLGLGKVDINPELMKLSISVLRGTSNGKKNIPVVVTDIYGNTYKTDVSVKIVSRDIIDFDWDEANIYFAVTDRFFDGNTKNNKGVDKKGSLSYHGGDFAGLEKKLDYLKELGINTIWITPIVSNSDINTKVDDKTIESTGYHGYWADDFTKLNPHLGSEKEFASLTKAIHNKGMKIMVDVVLNHAGYKTEKHFNTLLDDGKGNYIPMIRDSGNTIAGDDVYSSLSGLPDFVTENKVVRNQLINWQSNWVEKFGIDYFRIDTVKHVDPTTWAAFKNKLTFIDPDFKMIGEYAGAGYSNNAGMLGTGTMDSLLDFDFNDQAQSFVNGNISSVERFMQNRNKAINNTATLGAFLSSHDEDGLVYKLIDQNGYTESQALNLFKVAASLEMTAKGQTVVYYGEELGQYGADNYPYQTNRYDFDWKEMEKQSKDKNSMLNHYKKILSARNKYKNIFTKGTRTSVAVSDKEDYEVFKRTYNKMSIYVGLNIKSSDKTVTISVGDKINTVYKDVYSGKTYKTDKNGKIKITIPKASQGGTAILVKEGTIMSEKDFQENVKKLFIEINDLMVDIIKKYLK